jgi:hypothetical protein
VSMSFSIVQVSDHVTPHPCEPDILLQSLPGLKRLFNTLIMSTPAIFNVGSLLFLVMFVYGVLGMTLFGTEPRLMANRHAHFRNIGSSLLLLFRVFTADDWTIVMQATSGCDSFGYQCNTLKVSDTLMLCRRTKGQHHVLMLPFLSANFPGTVLGQGMFLQLRATQAYASAPHDQHHHEQHATNYDKWPSCRLQLQPFSFALLSLLALLSCKIWSLQSLWTTLSRMSMNQRLLRSTTFVKLPIGKWY